MTRNIVVIVPTEKESLVILERGTRVVNCGVGMAECAAATAKIIVDRQPSLVILAGIAGTYSHNIEVGETVIVESETIADLGRLTAGVLTPLYQKTYVSKITPKGFKHAKSNTTNAAAAIIAEPMEADIENMEGAAFFAVCERFGIPAMEVRTISNRVGEKIGGKNMEIAINRLALDLETILASLAATSSTR